MEKKVCGAKLRGKNAYCQKPPMKGKRRCRLHGGATPSGPDSPNFKHGRYAEAFKGQMAGKFKQASADEQPLDLLPELAVQRSVLSQYIASRSRSMTATDAERINALATDVVNTTAKIARMRNDEALTATEIRFFQAGILRILEKYVPDPNSRRNFIRELYGIIPRRIATPTDEPASLPISAGETG